MFEGKYTDDVTGEEITDTSDMVEITIKDTATKETRTKHLARETFDDLLEGNVTPSEVLLGD
jgi:hypothetical protein